ncbi:hypothetical protein I4F81_006469 [Pyropia yezoensis]|uniref:Uncharacterized protein n=1 Tax=Pyropia yezoensis TaxID=2788 RepID=A0ACC3C2E2_PYRYE|nr:hypothetical protein I4F81_006469 [Neopyropia yezoensis]
MAAGGRGGSHVGPSKVYGAEHLLRLLVKLPDLLAAEEVEPTVLRAIAERVNDIARFIKKNARLLFCLDYEAACLGWTGVCVEPLVRYHAGIYARRRRCELVPFCLANEAKGVTVIEAMDLSGIAATNKNTDGEAAWRVAVAPRRHLDCTTAADVLSHARLSRGDWMSLDVEGGELDVLRGIDWAAVIIITPPADCPRGTAFCGCTSRAGEQPASEG